MNQRKVVYLTNHDVVRLYGDMCQRILQKADPEQGLITLYGIPRGGIPVLYLFARHPKFIMTERPEQANVFVDDIIATGATRDRYLHNYPQAQFEALIPAPEPGVWYVFPWEATLESSAEDVPTRMLEFIGEDPKRNGLLDTPKRVVKSWGELYRGYNEDPKSLVTVFDNDGKYDEMVTLDNVEFFSCCEHHLLPFFGKATLSYIPRSDGAGKIIGISKLARILDCYARRLQVQERLTQQVADFLWEILNPLGVGVQLKAQHLCMVARGVKQSDAFMTTTAVRGLMKEDPMSRNEFLSLCK